MTNDRADPGPGPAGGAGGALQNGAAVLLRHARRLVVLVVGGTVVAVGIALLFLPGPAVLVIPAGIAILATEFAWARRLLREVKARIAGDDAARPIRRASARRDRDAGDGRSW